LGTLSLINEPVFTRDPKEQDFLSNDEAALLSGYLKWLAGKNNQELRK